LSSTPQQIHKKEGDKEIGKEKEKKKPKAYATTYILALYLTPKVSFIIK
jgi:hypothetical protein